MFIYSRKFTGGADIVVQRNFYHFIIKLITIMQKFIVLLYYLICIIVYLLYYLIKILF